MVQRTQHCRDIRHHHCHFPYAAGDAAAASVASAAAAAAAAAAATPVELGILTHRLPVVAYTFQKSFKFDASGNV